MLYAILGALAMATSVRAGCEITLRECEYTLDFIFMYLSSMGEETTTTDAPMGGGGGDDDDGGMGVVTVTDQCSYMEGGSGDMAFGMSWEYECRSDGLYGALYDDSTSCAGSANLTRFFESGDDSEGTWWSCEGDDNCDVKLDVDSCGQGGAINSGRLWMAKDTCLSVNDTGMLFRCDKDTESTVFMVVRDDDECGDDYTFAFEIAMIRENVCMGEVEFAVNCSGAGRFGVGLATLLALIAAYLF